MMMMIMESGRARVGTRESITSCKAATSPLQIAATDCDKQNSADDGDDVDHHDDGGLEFG